MNQKGIVGVILIIVILVLIGIGAVIKFLIPGE